MDYVWFATLLAGGLFVSMLLFMELGRWVGIRQIAKDPKVIRAKTGAVEGAVFALLGLLVAFTFSGAASRFDARRHLIIDEANAIGTAYLRLDLLPVSAQPVLRDLFRRYLDSRIETYRKLPNIQATLTELAYSKKLQREIWSQAVAACLGGGASPAASIILLPALNNMIDIENTRFAVTRLHPPIIIFVMLFLLGLICALMAGYDMAFARMRSWFHLFGFAAITTITIFVILNIEYPRVGLIRIDAFDKTLVELRESMK